VSARANDTNPFTDGRITVPAPIDVLRKTAPGFACRGHKCDQDRERWTDEVPWSASVRLRPDGAVNPDGGR